MEPSEILEVMHGTTVASNAILELKGARVGLIGTDGFRDILEIRNLRMPRLYDLEWIKPPPLVDRYLRVVVPERIDAYGKVEKPLERVAAEAAVDRLRAEGVEAIKGQIFELTVPLPDGPLDAAALRKIEVAFGDEHETTYGHRAGLDEPVELVNAQVVGRGAPRGRRTHGAYLAPDRAFDHPAPREAYFGPGTGWLETPILSRAGLKDGVQGPCIVEEYDSTCLIPPGADAKLDASGNIRIDLAAR